MTKAQAFSIAFLLLFIQTCFLIVSGYKLGGQYTVPTFLLFALVDFVLLVLCKELNIVNKE